MLGRDEGLLNPGCMQGQVDVLAEAYNNMEFEFNNEKTWARIDGLKKRIDETCLYDPTLVVPPLKVYRRGE